MAFRNNTTPKRQFFFGLSTNRTQLKTYIKLKETHVHASEEVKEEIGS